MTSLVVDVEPIEPILFGDNRSARAGEDHALTDQDPSPLTLFGAVGARIAAAFGAGGPADWDRVEPVLGGFRYRLGEPGDGGLDLRGFTLLDEQGDAWFPAPAHLRYEEVRNEVRPFDLLVPRRFEEGVELSSSPFPCRLVATGSEPPQEAEGAVVVRHALLAAALAGELPDGDSTGAGRPGDLARPEPRIGLTIANRTNQAVEGRLFTRPYRRFAERIGEERPWSAAGYRAWLGVDGLAGRVAADLSGVGFVGGDRGRARFAFREGEDDALAGLREAVLARVETAAGWLLYLLTPGLADLGWPEIEKMHPVATAVGRPRRISGWDAHGHHPRPMRTLIPEGSVAFYPWPSADPAARRALVARWWLGRAAEPFAREGFGRTLVGLWGSADA